MPHILAADSLNGTSDAVTARAAAISQALGAELRLLHVLPELLPDMLAAPRRRRAQTGLMARTSALARRTGARVSYKVVRGDVSGQILRESEDLGSMLTVIGNGGGAKRLLSAPGGTTMRCLARTRNAVLVVRGGNPGGAYRRALIAHDDAVGEERLLPYLPHLAPQATLHSFAVPPAARGRPAARNACAHVTAMRRAIDADLLVIGVPRDESLNPFRFRRLPAALARTPECDTLFVPHETTVAPPEAETAMRIRVAV